MFPALSIEEFSYAILKNPNHDSDLEKEKPKQFFNKTSNNMIPQTNQT